jgi:hypothetical protein
MTLSNAVLFAASDAGGRFLTWNLRTTMGLSRSRGDSLTLSRNAQKFITQQSIAITR